MQCVWFFNCEEGGVARKVPKADGQNGQLGDEQLLDTRAYGIDRRRTGKREVGMVSNRIV